MADRMPDVGETLMEKPFTAEEIERAQFPIAIRGYDRDEVDAYLKMLAADYRELEHLASRATQTSERPYEALGQEIGSILQQAKNAADAMRRKAQEEAAALRLNAQDDAAKKKRDAMGAAQRVIEQAQREAKGIITAAEREAAEHLKEAARRIQRLQATETDLSKRLTGIEATLHTVQKELETSRGTSLAEEVAQLSELNRAQGKSATPEPATTGGPAAARGTETKERGSEDLIFLDEPVEDDRS